MPVITSSKYRPPVWMRGGHAQTILPALFRQVRQVTDRVERIELADGDFLDLEWHREERRRLVILSHGLEGSAAAVYIQGMAATMIEAGWDVLAWNHRSCSGEMNRRARFYHSGATEDLLAVVEHALAVHPAERVDLIGFSLGGNLTLKFLGEQGGGIDPRIRAAVAFSVPCDLACSSRRLASPFNRAIYMKRFIDSLAAKVRRKARHFPVELDPARLKGVRTFREFDDRFTAPLHGFRDAQDYWERSSSRPFLAAIRIPSLLVNAANDPFLGPACYPWEEAGAGDYLHLEVPEEGGHVGFPERGGSWAERRAPEFLRAIG